MVRSPRCYGQQEIDNVTYTAENLPLNDVEGHQTGIDRFPDFTGFNFTSYILSQKCRLSFLIQKEVCFFFYECFCFLKSIGEVLKRKFDWIDDIGFSFSWSHSIIPSHRELSAPNMTVPCYFQTGTLYLLKAVRVSRNCSFCTEFSLFSSFSSLFHLSVVPCSAFALKKNLSFPRPLSFNSQPLYSVYHQTHISSTGDGLDSN